MRMHCNSFALQLKAARRCAVPIRLNFIARAKFELALHIHCHLRAFLLLIRYVTLWRWTMIPWPWPNICSVPAVPCSNSVRNLSAIRQSTAELLRFEYLTLWPWICITCCAMLWDSLHKLKTQSSYPFMRCNDFLMLIRPITLWPWPLTHWPWTLWYFRPHVSKPCVKFERNRTVRGRVINDLAHFGPWNFGPRPKQLNRSQGCVDQIAPNLQRTQSDHGRV